jgi:hypothetical protein
MRPGVWRLACAQGTIYPTCELYSPSANGWTTTGAMHEARYLHRAVLLPSGNVLVAGGFGLNPTPCTDPMMCPYAVALNTSEIYSPASGTWAEAAQMPYARYAHSMVTLPTGLVLVTGGVGNQNNPGDNVALSSSLLYNETANTWTATGPLVLPDSDFFIGSTAVLFSA